jgi:hypothetical protein
VELASYPNREFQLWAYTVGMRRLLFRNTKLELFATRVDIMFQNVKALRTSTSVRGLVIRSPTEDEHHLVETEIGHLSEHGQLFMLDSEATWVTSSWE